jgi:excisionase family DNA binding protein
VTSLIERHYTTSQLAGLLAAHPETIRRAAASGRLQSVRVGSERRYSESAVREWLRERDDDDRRRAA